MNQHSQIPEEDWLPISALQHFSYCPRQCALIHVEQVFEENLHTMRGRAVHRLVDSPETHREHGMRIERALPLYSRWLGLTGKADVVEFGLDGAPYPVEYKHGPKREKLHDNLQLTAQAICLEEMSSRFRKERSSTTVRAGGARCGSPPNCAGWLMNWSRERGKC